MSGLAPPGSDVKEKEKKERLCNNWREHGLKTSRVVHLYITTSSAEYLYLRLPLFDVNNDKDSTYVLA